MTELTPRETAIERPLGATEDMYWRFDAVSPLNFGSVVRLSGAFTTEQLKLGLAALQQRHPLMRARIVLDDDGTPWFRSRVGPVPLQEAWQPPGGEWALLENELNTPFDTRTGPLSRCVLVRHSDEDASLVWVYHHAACDGRSATFLLRDLVQSLSQQIRGESSRLKPLPPIEYYGDRIHTLRDYEDFEDGLKTAWRTLQTSAKFMTRVGIPMGIRSEQAAPLSEQRILVEPRFVDADLMKRLAVRAKSEGTTIQCVLNAALSLMVAQDSPTRSFEVTSCTQVLDIRDRLHPPVGEDCGVFVTGATSLHSLKPDTDFWELTRDIHRCLRETMNTPLPFFHPALHRSFAMIGKALGRRKADIFSQMIKRLHPEGLAVSNLGQVRIDVPDAAIQVKEFGFATNTNVFNYFNTSAATLNGRMTWSFSGSTLLGRDRIALIADHTIERMEKALRE
ncbi:MAG: condensation domain-containing protein [Ketobacteraceae bacterium]|nr:condensation domain-containing protein [Ketobacteraceae bacterium]